MSGRPESNLNPSTPVLLSLSVGQTWSKVVRLDGDMTDKEAMRSALADLRNATNSAVARAKAHKDKPDYVTETFTHRTSSFDHLVGICVTRTM